MSNAETISSLKEFLAGSYPDIAIRIILGRKVAWRTRTAFSGNTCQKGWSSRMLTTNYSGGEEEMNERSRKGIGYKCPTDYLQKLLTAA